jgi:hypothetical protein
MLSSSISYEVTGNTFFKQDTRNIGWEKTMYWTSKETLKKWVWIHIEILMELEAHEWIP